MTVQIAFKQLPHSDALEQQIREKAEKLHRLNDRITSCRVSVEAPHRHHHKGQLFEVHIELHVPGHDLRVTRESKDHSHEDISIAVRDAFNAAYRQLEDISNREKSEKRRGAG